MDVKQEVSLFFSRLLLLSLVACSVQAENISKLTRLSGVQLPEDTVMESEDFSVGNEKTKFTRRILFSRNQIAFVAGEQFKVPSASTIALLKKMLPAPLVGKPDSYVIGIEWQNSNGKWRGFWLHTSDGYYLDLEQMNTDG